MASISVWQCVREADGLFRRLVVLVFERFGSCPCAAILLKSVMPNMGQKAQPSRSRSWSSSSKLFIFDAMLQDKHNIQILR